MDWLTFLENYRFSCKIELRFYLEGSFVPTKLNQNNLMSAVITGSWKSYDYHREHDVLVVSTRGERGFSKVASQSIDMWRQIEKECQVNSLHKVLILSEMKGRLKPSDSFQIVEFISKCKIDPILVLAIVASDPHAYDDIKFSEAVAKRRRMIFRAFDSEKAAKAWLKMK